MSALAAPVKLEAVPLQQAIQQLARSAGLNVQGVEHLGGTQAVSMEGEPRQLLESLL